MKKIFIMAICVLLICILALPIFAAQSATVSVAASATEVSRGDSVTITVCVTTVDDCTSGGFMFSYDKEVFEYVSGSSLSGVSGYMAGVSTAAGNIAGYFMNGKTTVSGGIFEITLKIKDDAEIGTYDISGTPSLTATDGSVSCSVSSASITVVCNHRFTAKDTDASYQATPASCTNKATYYYSCTGCGEKGTDTFEHGTTLDHTYTKQVISDTYKKSAATCTAKAVYYYCCETCTAKGTETFEYGTTLEHTFTKKVTTDAYKAAAADCTNAAKYYYCCTTCTAKGSETYTNGSALGHTGGTATCTAKAECTRCHQAYGNMLDHVYTAQDAVAKYLKSEATCTSKAVYYKHCATCDKAGTATFEYGTTKAHTYTKQVISDTYKKSAATCTAKAVYYYCCETCTAKGTETFEYGTVLDHTFTKKVTTDAYKAADADCTNAAKYYYCCTTCTAKGSETYTNGSALGHTGGTATCTAKAECTRCHQAYGNMLDHVYTAQDAVAKYLKSEATCTAKAVYYKHCATCDKAGTATFEYGTTKAHTYTKQVISDTYKKSAATCTAKAVYYYCCETCTAKGTETFEYGTTLDHTFTKKVTTDAYKAADADCTNEAKYYYCCTTCTAKGSETYTNGSALGHTGGTATCTAKAECTRCHQAYGNMLDHVYTAQDAVAKYLKSEATCTSKAVYYKHCATCDKAGTATFEYGTTKAHTYTKQVISDTYKKSAATCTAKAVYYYCCETCTAKGTETFEYGTVLDHTFTKKVTTDAYKAAAADCTNAAKYYYCCATCDLKGTTTYQYGSALGHTGGTATCTTQAVCTRCSNAYGGTLAHDYSDENATAYYLKSEATCTSRAVYYKSCVDCGEMGTTTFEYGATKAHSYIDKIEDAYLKSAETCTANAVYYKSCSVCGAEGNDTFEAAGSPNHDYQTVWSNDATSHWHECNKCQDKKDLALHVAGDAATETTAQKCTVCGYVITPALGHTHNYSLEWTNNANEHWHSCVGCSSVKDIEVHSYTNACDAECNICGYKREITHSYKTEWIYNAEQHWYECSVCKDKTSVSSHTPGAAATETTAQTCTVCGYVLKDALGHTHSFGVANKDETNHWNECACGEKSNVTAHTWNDGVITKEATYIAEGEKTYTCTTCDITKTEVVDKLETTDEIISVDNSKVEIAVPDESDAILDKNAVFRVEEIKENISDNIKANIKIAVGEDGKADVLVSYDISLILEGVAVQPGGLVEVTLPAPENAGDYAALQVVFVDDDGSVTPCETKVNADGTVTFVTDHFSYYAIVGVQNAASTVWIWIAAIGFVLILGAIAVVVVVKKKRA